MEKYSDKAILSGIKNRKDIILRYLYSDYFPQVMRIVIKHGGSEQDARDLFQEALIIIFNRLKEGQLVIKSSFHNYFIVLCRFIWFRQNNIKQSHTDIDKVDGYIPVGPSDEGTLQETGGDRIIAEYFHNQKEKIFQRHYRKLPGDCKRVLKMFFRKRSFREIAGKMEYTTEDYARRKKYLCMQQLMKMINNDQEYISLIKKNREQVE